MICTGDAREKMNDAEPRSRFQRKSKKKKRKAVLGPQQIQSVDHLSSKSPGLERSAATPNREAVKNTSFDIDHYLRRGITAWSLALIILFFTLLFMMLPQLGKFEFNTTSVLISLPSALTYSR